MYGRVTKYFHEKGYGFIRGDDGRSYFVHESKLQGEYIDAGYYVFFRPFQNNKSDYNAEEITVIEAQERKRSNGKTHK